MAKGVRSTGGFKVSAVTPVGNWDPSQKGMPVKPVKPKHRTVTYDAIMADNGPLTNGMMTTTAASPATGSFEVADNTFPAVAELLLGDYRLVNNFDYAIGAAAADTATNIAAAISLLPNFTASAVGTTVTVNYAHAADSVTFKAIHHGIVESFTTFTGGGFLTLGSPKVGPPVLA